jgi:hypothetical protein
MVRSVCMLLQLYIWVELPATWQPWRHEHRLPAALAHAASSAAVILLDIPLLGDSMRSCYTVVVTTIDWCINSNGDAVRTRRCNKP